MTGTLEVERDGGRADIIITNESRRNTVSLEMWQALPGILDDLAADVGVLVVVLRGAGSDFSAGADIASLAAIFGGSESNGVEGGWTATAETALANFPKPTIAAIDGYCVGGGWLLAGACDLRIATTRAKFGVTPARLGIVYPVSAIERLVRLVGLQVARYLLFTADLVTAGRAEKWGLILEAVDAGLMADRIETLVTTITSRSQLSIAAAKELTGYMAAGSDTSAIAEKWAAEVESTSDARTGIDAFLGKHAPGFTWRFGAGG
jgi:enoyl-CoA hydratase/carnithine racemase